MIFFVQSLIFSSLLYLYLIRKTNINRKYLFLDNVVVLLFSGGITYWLYTGLKLHPALAAAANMGLVPFFLVLLSLLRFFRVPRRKSVSAENDLLSPADGKIIYIKEIEAGDIPFSIKNKQISRLSELTKTDILKVPCRLVGINMTLFDVHENCAPLSGEIILNTHTPGKFLSLKQGEAVTENERNTMVFKKQDVSVGMVQIASKRVRRIVSYHPEGTQVRKGQWVGRITFGSQVDVIFPLEYDVTVGIGEQVYAGKTIIAKWKKN